MFAAITPISEAQYLLPITKHEPTKKYYTTIDIGSAANSHVNLLLDLGTNLTGCDGKFCLYRQPNPLGYKPFMTTGHFVQDKATIYTTDGKELLSSVSIRRFTFSCAAQFISPPIAGVLALSPGEFPFWIQVTSAFNVIPKRFCSSSSSFSEPSSSSPLPTKRSKVKINVAIESVRGGGTGFGSITRQSTLDRFIARADLKPPPPDPQVVSDPSFECGNNDSVGIDPETAKTWIYPGMFQIPGLAPFKHCFEEGSSRRNMKEFMNVPVIEIGLPGNGREVKWRFDGANTVVRFLETVICLAFVD
ncbi:hypothetical protein DY000_02018495 [Brassica cretica]|uniref:Xylanase inhibitor C-terminal domain-containing protein n=1 Tax=Brassica cretica TaxID=69181 RepID=A0ABQ7CVQ1_BRACR|nr:hypothetical protein DY000_02018495 [Brassica cretica]